MGVRLYNRATGLFTSMDPVHGGNTTPYTYPQDPINHTDLDGHEGRWAKYKRHAVTLATCRSFGRRACAKITTITALVARLLPSGKYKDPNKDNAVRHFAWMALLYFHVSRSAAAAMGWAHEYGLHRSNNANERRDSRRDTPSNHRSIRLMDRWYPHSSGRSSMLSLALNYRYFRRLGERLYNRRYFVSVSNAGLHIGHHPPHCHCRMRTQASKLHQRGMGRPPRRSTLASAAAPDGDQAGGTGDRLRLVWPKHDFCLQQTTHRKFGPQAPQDRLFSCGGMGSRLQMHR